MLENLLLEYEKAGFAGKFSVYKKIIRYLYDQRDDKIFECSHLLFDLIDEANQNNYNKNILIQNQVSDIFAVIFKFINYIQKPDVFDEWYQYYKKYEDFITDPVSKAEIFQTFGFYFWLKQNYKKASLYLEESLNIITKFGNLTDIPSRYTNPGYIYESTGNIEQAEHYYLAGLDFAKKNNLEESLNVALNALGRLYFSIKNYEKATYYFNQALLMLDPDENSMNKAVIVSNLAGAYNALNDNTKALQLCNSIKNEWMKEHNYSFYIDIVYNMSSIHLKLNDYDTAEVLLNEFLEFWEKHPDTIQYIKGLINKAEVLICKKEFIESFSTLMKAKEIALRNDNQKLLLRIYLIIGQYYFHIEQYDKLLKHFSDKIDFIIEHKDNSIITEVYRLIYQTYEKFEDYKNALSYYKLFSDIKEKHLNETFENEKKILEKTLSHNEQKKLHFYKILNSVVTKEQSELIGTYVIGTNSKFLDAVNIAVSAGFYYNTNVSIFGQSGAGKETFAKLIHFTGALKDKPFISVKKAVFSTDLAYCAMFGSDNSHECNKQASYIEQANSGTLYLEEIEAIGLDIQEKLIEMLKTKRIISIKTGREIPVNIRLICSSSQNLDSLKNNSNIKAEFLELINVVKIEIPPLSERKEDIPLLVDYFTTTTCNRLMKDVPIFEPETLKILCEKDYKENVRELKNYIERIILFSVKDVITKDNLLALPDL